MFGFGKVMKNLKFLCPITKNKLTPANKNMIKEINQIIRRRKIYSAGKRVAKPIHAAWIESNWQRIYPVVDGIAYLLKDSALNISDRQVFDAGQPKLPTT